MPRVRAAIATIALAVTILATACTPAAPSSPHTPAPKATAAVHPGPHDDGPHPPLLPSATTRPRAAAPRTATVRTLTAGTYAVNGLDLHDASLTQYQGTYYLVGSMYGCGFQWYVANTPWCGFGVSTAPALTGPWSAPHLLYSPSDIDPWSGLTWTAECGSTGQGCFNPRFVIRSGWGANDGVPILWFNSPIDWSRSKSNAYNIMGCASLVGPCGPGAVPNGSYHKPTLSVCSGNGDFGIITAGAPGQAPAIVCTMAGAASLSIEEIDKWGANGTGTGLHNVANLAQIEGPGGYWDPASGQYVLTYSDPGCGYCTGTGSGYATAPTLYSGWSAPANVGFGQPLNGRRLISATSCGGQPRTISVIDGTPYQIIDTWTGNRNETTAGMVIAPVQTQATTGSPGDGQPWTTPYTYAC